MVHARKMKPGDEEHRYRLRVLLAADKRPKYWTWHCPKCTTPVAELSGDVIAVDDIGDLNAVLDYQPAPITVQCKGKFCRVWYEFSYLAPAAAPPQLKVTVKLPPVMLG